MCLYYLKNILNIKSSGKILNRLLEITSIRMVCVWLDEYILNAPYNAYMWVFNQFSSKVIEKVEK